MSNYFVNTINLIKRPSFSKKFEIIHFFDKSQAATNFGPKYSLNIILEIKKASIQQDFFFGKAKDQRYPEKMTISRMHYI